LLIFACSKVNPHEEIPQSKYAQMKQAASAYFTDYANALRTTGHKYFGHAHDGTFDKAQFAKDLSDAFSENHPTLRPVAYNKLLIKSWDPKKETLVDYMNQMGVSENVMPYVLETQNYVVSSFDIAKLESKEQDMNQVVANVVSNMNKIEAKVEQDKSLSESEIVSVLVATAAVTTDFFTNLNVGNVRNQAVLRSFWSFVRAVVNVVTTVVVRSFTYVALTIYYVLTDSVGPFIGSCFSGGCNVDGFFNSLGDIIDGIVFDFTHYNCYLPDDGWQCQ
jgi:hypothetical protein